MTTNASALPRAGDVVYIGRAASVQFAGANGFLFRMIRAHAWATYDGWAWLDGYQLNLVGDAVERRSIFIQPAGLQAATAARTARPDRARQVPVQTARSSRRRKGPGTR